MIGSLSNNSSSGGIARHQDLSSSASSPIHFFGGLPSIVTFMLSHFSHRFGMRYMLQFFLFEMLRRRLPTLLSLLLSSQIFANQKTSTSNALQSPPQKLHSFLRVLLPNIPQSRVTTPHTTSNVMTKQSEQQQQQKYQQTFHLSDEVQRTIERVKLQFFKKNWNETSKQIRNDICYLFNMEKHLNELARNPIVIQISKPTQTAPSLTSQATAPPTQQQQQQWESLKKDSMCFLPFVLIATTLLETTQYLEEALKAKYATTLATAYPALHDPNEIAKSILREFFAQMQLVGLRNLKSFVKQQLPKSFIDYSITDSIELDTFLTHTDKFFTNQLLKGNSDIKTPSDHKKRSKQQQSLSHFRNNKRKSSNAQIPSSNNPPTNNSNQLPNNIINQNISSSSSSNNNNSNNSLSNNNHSPSSTGVQTPLTSYLTQQQHQINSFFNNQTQPSQIISKPQNQATIKNNSILHEQANQKSTKRDPLYQLLEVENTAVLAHKQPILTPNIMLDIMQFYIGDIVHHKILVDTDFIEKHIEIADCRCREQRYQPSLSCIPEAADDDDEGYDSDHSTSHEHNNHTTTSQNNRKSHKKLPKQQQQQVKSHNMQSPQPMYTTSNTAAIPKYLTAVKKNKSLSFEKPSSEVGSNSPNNNKVIGKRRKYSCDSAIAPKSGNKKEWMEETMHDLVNEGSPDRKNSLHFSFNRADIRERTNLLESTAVESIEPLKTLHASEYNTLSTTKADFTSDDDSSMQMKSDFQKQYACIIDAAEGVATLLEKEEQEEDISCERKCGGSGEDGEEPDDEGDCEQDESECEASSRLRATSFFDGDEEDYNPRPHVKKLATNNSLFIGSNLNQSNQANATSLEESIEIAENRMRLAHFLSSVCFEALEIMHSTNFQTYLYYAISFAYRKFKNRIRTNFEANQNNHTSNLRIPVPHLIIGINRVLEDEFLSEDASKNCKALYARTKSDAGQLLADHERRNSGENNNCSDGQSNSNSALNNIARIFDEIELGQVIRDSFDELAAFFMISR